MTSVKIGIIGEFDPAFTPHLATNAALQHAGAGLDIAVKVAWLPTDTLESGITSRLDRMDGLLCPPGSPYRSLAGALAAITYAREHQVPFLGTCGGFQHALLEYARNVMGFEDAAHAEYDPGASRLFISQLVCSLSGQTLGVDLVPGTHAYALYRAPHVKEEYYCAFTLNPVYGSDLVNAGMTVSGRDHEGDVRIVELAGHPFYIATLFVPQTSSQPGRPHPLVRGFMNAAARHALDRASATGDLAGR